MVELELKGISGSIDRRLAIINFRTFSVDEEGEVPTDSGRARIRVIDIKSDSVVVIVNGQQRVLRLRSGL
jgi:predicted amino acid racemase